MEKLGTENLEKAVDLVIALIMQGEESVNHGFKLMSYLDELLMIPDIINNRQAIINEAKDADPEERQKMYDRFVLKFNLENDRAEAIIEGAYKLVDDLLNLIIIARKPKAPAL